MSLAATLTAFQAAALQCDRLIANAHRADSAGIPFFPALDQQQITVAAFLNLFRAWETFLEETLIQLMAGSPTISGQAPTRHVVPPTEDLARRIVTGTRSFFDYGNHEYVRTIVNLYFEKGYPFEPHLSAIIGDLNDFRTMRNSSAHIDSTTQTALESLAQRIFSTPRPRIELYTVLMTVDPRSVLKNTVFGESREKLLIAAALIATG